ncbi:hypothetical protein U1Q18_012952 [Sarracenia purpurea var. burkii]
MRTRRQMRNQVNQFSQHEKTVRLDDFTDSPVHGWLVGRGWTPILTATGDACLELVQEFYANLVSRPNEEYNFLTHIRGHSLHFDGTDVCRVLGIRDPPMQQYPPAPSRVNYDEVAQVLCGRPRAWYDGNIFQHELTEEYRLLNLIVSATINPRGHVSDINRDRGGNEVFSSR